MYENVLNIFYIFSNAFFSVLLIYFNLNLFQLEAKPIHFIYF